MSALERAASYPTNLSRSPSASRTVQGFPQSLVGRWTGTPQQGGGQFEIEIEIVPATVGSSVGSYEIGTPGSGHCTFTTQLLSYDSQSIVFKNNLVSGRDCVSGLVTLRSRSTGSVDYHWTDDSRSARRHVPDALGVLFRA
jgi:hypothetical protein